MCQSQSSKSEFHTALGGSALHMLFVIVFAVVGFLALYVAPAKAELIDAKGDFLYFLFLNENLVSAEDGSKEAPPLRTFDPKINFDSRGWHTQKMRAFMRRLERDYGIQAVSLTSWSLPSFSAYIPESTLGLLRADPRVREVHLVEDDEVFSTWGDQVAGNEIISWGKLR